MDDRPEPAPLADDPSFLASLDDLDRGLGGGDRSASPRSRAFRPWPGAQAPPLSDLILPPRPPPGASPAYSRMPGRAKRRPPANAGPFDASCDPTFFYPAASHDRVAQEMLSAIRHREGIVVVTGPPGAGKTMVCRAVLERLDRRTLTSFAPAAGTPEDLLRTILADVGVISRDDLSREHVAGAGRVVLTSVLRDFLLTLAPLEAFVVVIVDGAEAAPTDVLDQLRLLADLEEGQRLLQIVLVGQPALARRLRQPALQQLAHRVAVRCDVGPLAPEEIGPYVAHRLGVAGVCPAIDFDEEAIERLEQWSAGMPAAVNAIGDRASSIAREEAAGVVDGRIVDLAADDLGLARRTSMLAAVARRVAGVLAILLLVLAGAGAAAWVFQARLARAAVRWQAVPSAPPTPALAAAPPIAPRPVPEGLR